MSASEKLRALRKTGLTAEHWTDYDASDMDVFDELLAVVEAAEFYLRESTSGRPALTIGIEQSLTALDEALS